jgi:predicted DCC family thiol-disulfide oxidoreductase YuxK
VADQRSGLPADKERSWEAGRARKAGPVSLLYDADCSFCTWTLAGVLAMDRRRALRPVALQSAEAARLLAGMSEQERMTSWHLVTAGGEIRSAGAAAAPLLHLLPAARPLAVLLERFPAVTERAYRWVADHRSAFGRLLPESAKARARRRVAARSA